MRALPPNRQTDVARCLKVVGTHRSSLATLSSPLAARCSLLVALSFTREASMSLLVLGSVAFDDVRTPRAAREKVLGGSATYFAWAASTLVRTHLVAAVGRDFPAGFTREIEQRGIDVSGLHREPQAATFDWTGYYGADVNEAHPAAV